jgi:hypothetical protein
MELLLLIFNRHIQYIIIVGDSLLSLGMTELKGI